MVKGYIRYRFSRGCLLCFVYSAYLIGGAIELCHSKEKGRNESIHGTKRTPMALTYLFGLLAQAS